jgi:phosphate starvation-inducible PhoH-like protein
VELSGFCMAEITLHYESARAVQSLYANDPAHLRLLDELLGVKATVRDGWLKLSGKASEVEKARGLFEQLHLARQRGVSIRRHEFRYGLGLVAEGRGAELGHLLGERIALSSKRSAITPKTLGQREYVGLIRSKSVVFGVGPAGTGKTYLAMAMGIAALKAGQADRIILTRPAVEAGENLGFLPGDLQEKLLPYLRPLYDALHDMVEVEEIQRFMDRGVIEIAPLAYMRGRTLSRAFVVLDEAQNATTEQMFMFLTRLGQESKCVVTGDPTQVDLSRTRKSGLIEALQALQGVEDIGIHVFQETDVVRHEVVARIITAYRNFRGERNTSLSL